MSSSLRTSSFSQNLMMCILCKKKNLYNSYFIGRIALPGKARMYAD
jgi:hypothetical protein